MCRPQADVGEGTRWGNSGAGQGERRGHSADQRPLTHRLAMLLCLSLSCSCSDSESIESSRVRFHPAPRREPRTRKCKGQTPTHTSLADRICSVPTLSDCYFCALRL